MLIQLVAPQTTYGPAGLPVATFAIMVPRRNVFDPLEPTREPRWSEVRDMHARILESRLLPAGANLKRVLVAVMLERIHAGWKLSEWRAA